MRGIKRSVIKMGFTVIVFHVELYLHREVAERFLPSNHSPCEILDLCAPTNDGFCNPSWFMVRYRRVNITPLGYIANELTVIFLHTNVMDCTTHVVRTLSSSNICVCFFSFYHEKFNPFLHVACRNVLAI